MKRPIRTRTADDCEARCWADLRTGVWRATLFMVTRRRGLDRFAAWNGFVWGGGQAGDLPIVAGIGVEVFFVLFVLFFIFEAGVGNGFVW